VQYETEVGPPTKMCVDQTSLFAPVSNRDCIVWALQTGPDGSVIGDLAKLSKFQKQELTRVGLLAGRDFPTWIVFKTFHWQQRSPAHLILHVKMEYSSTPGLVHLTRPSCQEESDLLFDSCVDPSLRKRLISAAPNNRGSRELVRIVELLAKMQLQSAPPNKPMEAWTMAEWNAALDACAVSVGTPWEVLEKAAAQLEKPN